MSFLVIHGGAGFASSNPSSTTHGRLDGNAQTVRAGEATLTMAALDRDSAGTLLIGNTTATALTVGSSGVTATVAGSLTVTENFTVNGTSFTASVSTVDIQDNIILLNDGAGTADVDTGWLSQRSQAENDAGTGNIVSGGMSASVTGVAQAGAATTITLAAGSSATDDFYNGWWLKITDGTGPNQVRQITDYVGATKVATVSGWTTTPDNTSEYSLFSQGYTGVIWDESAGEMVAGASASEPGLTAATITESIPFRASRVRLDLESDPSLVSGAGFIYSGSDAGDPELFYLDGVGNPAIQITKDGSLNSGALSVTLDGAYTAGRSITQDLGPITMAGDSSTVGGMIALAPNVAAENAPQLAIDFQEIAATGVHTGVRVDYSQMTSLSSASSFSAIDLFGKLNAGAGLSYGVKIDPNFDEAIVIGEQPTVRMNLTNESTNTADYLIRTIDGVDDTNACGMTFQTGTGGADSGASGAAGGSVDFLLGAGGASAGNGAGDSGTLTVTISAGGAGNTSNGGAAGDVLFVGGVGGASGGANVGGAGTDFSFTTGTGGAAGIVGSTSGRGGNYTILVSEAGSEASGSAGANGYYLLEAGGQTHGAAAAGGINMAAAAFDLNSLGAVTIDASSGGISLDALGASNFTTTSGDLTIGGATQANAVNIQSTEGTADSIYLNANTGAGGITMICGSSGFDFDSTGGSYTFDTTAGGFSVDVTTACNITSTTGVLTLGGATQTNSIDLQTIEASATAIYLYASNVAGGVTISSGSNGIDMDSVGGPITIDSTGGGFSVDVFGASNITTTSGTMGVTGASQLNLSSSTASANIVATPGTAAARGQVIIGASTDTTLNSLVLFDGGGTNLASEIVMYDQGGNAYTLWIDASGDLRVVQAATKGTDGAGTIVGTQGG